MKKLDTALPDQSKNVLPEKKVPIKGKVESINNRQITGWAIDTGHAKISLSLLINGAVYATAPEWNDRSDVSAKFGEEFLPSGFTINIPQALRAEFTTARRNGQAVEVMANGAVLRKNVLNSRNSAQKTAIRQNPHKNIEFHNEVGKINKLFVCIGAQKAGTSWLFENLSKDQRFSKCPFVKEIHYFDYLYKNSPHLNNWRANYFLRTCQSAPASLKPIISAWLSNDIGKLNKLADDNNGMLVRKINLLLNSVTDEWYADLLRLRKNQEYAMDITPDYAVIGTDGFKHMKSIAHDLKLLLILRDPVERAWSGLLQGKKQQPGGIAKFIEEKGEDIDFLFKSCSTGPDIGARNNYLMTLEALEEVGLADEGHLLIRFYDDISNDPDKLVKEIYRFLEIPPPEPDIFSETLRSRVYATPKTVMPPELKIRLKAHYANMLQQINDRFTSIPDTWL
jgi:hypothetical protein